MSVTSMFAGTRVPVQALLDYLEAGDGIDEFLAAFPSVTRQQVIDFSGTGRLARHFRRCAKALLDECVDIRLASCIAGLDVRTFSDR